MNLDPSERLQQRRGVVETERPRCECKKLTERVAGLTAELDRSRAEVRRLTYGGPVSTHTRTYDEHVETLVRVDFDALLVAIGQVRDGHPGAERYDTPRTAGHTTTKFCEDHEQDDCPCGEATTYPAISDPTGELAIRLAERHDTARNDIDAAHRARRFVRDASRILTRLHFAYAPRDADAYQRVAQSAPPGCRSCARLRIKLGDGTEVPRWTEVHQDQLCRWCYDWRRKVQGLPPLDKLADHHDGKRVTVPTKGAA